MTKFFTNSQFFLTFFLVIFFTQSFLFAQVQNGSFIHDGETRYYKVFLPQNFQPNMPVVFNLTGYGSTAQDIITYSLMNDVADTAGFVAVYPEPVQPAWNSGIIHRPTPNVDDVGFITELIDTVHARYNIDESRVYCCGYSNGAHMTQRLAYWAGYRFAAVGSICGTMTDCTAVLPPPFNRSMPFLILNGTADTFVLWLGGVPGMYAVEQMLNFWIQNNNCVLNADTISLPDLDPNDGCTVEKISYTNCSDSVQILFYKIINGGHTWPSGNRTFWPGGGNMNMDINANVEMWNFFKHYTNDLAYGKSIDVNPKYLNPQGDTLSVLAELNNPQNHQVEVFAMIHNDDFTFQDSIQLFDDGLHNDRNPNDNIWGGAKWFSVLNEEYFTTTLITYDIMSGTNITSRFKAHFTTSGPVVLDHYQITSSDTIVDDGDRIKFEYTLKNSGLSATAMNITSKVIPLDTFSTATNVVPSYGNIQAGNLAVGSIGQYIRFNHGFNPGIDVQFRIDIFSNNNLFWSDTFSVFVYSGLTFEDKTLPSVFFLKQNYPNPFNPETSIEFSIPKTEFVTLKIYNLLGQEVATLVSNKLTPGNYQYTWDAGKLASGVYLYRLQAGNYNETRKMILLQ